MKLLPCVAIALFLLPLAGCERQPSYQQQKFELTADLFHCRSGSSDKPKRAQAAERQRCDLIDDELRKNFSLEQGK